MISIIAAIGKNRELGKDNQLIFHIKEDMRFFKDTTMGHPVLMGRKTFASIGRPLPGRTNYVVTSHPELLPSGVRPVTDLADFLASHADSGADEDSATPVNHDEVFVIGGGTIYEAALPYATHLYLTEVDASAGADTFFPEFDKSKYSNKLIKKGKENDLTYQFVKYIKK
ncbi:dihydrofolate reductase [Candidatus Saccharibacteria bacterium]|nr:dihydrofolate reductase [Candidatus Saccharibacteria bacterium]